MNLIKDFSWSSTDGVRRYPARGEMNHRHIHNCMRYLEERNRGNLLALHMSIAWKALQKGLRMPDPGEYANQDPNWRLGSPYEEYTLEEHNVYTTWATRRRTVR